jgi:hypothetical protein
MTFEKYAADRGLSRQELLEKICFVRDAETFSRCAVELILAALQRLDAELGLKSLDARLAARRAWADVLQDLAEAVWGRLEKDLGADLRGIVLGLSASGEGILRVPATKEFLN